MDAIKLNGHGDGIEWELWFLETYSLQLVAVYVQTMHCLHSMQVSRRAGGAEIACVRVHTKRNPTARALILRVVSCPFRR